MTKDLQRNVGDLAMLVAQLVRALRKAAPEHDLPARALDYLQREGLCGSPLRETPNAKVTGSPALSRRSGWTNCYASGARKYF